MSNIIKTRDTINNLINKHKEVHAKSSVLYFVENLVKIEDRDSLELAVPFTLWDGQKTVLDRFINDRLNIVLKARQMGLTWLALAYSVHCIVYNSGYQVVAMSKKEEDAKELVRRMTFILRHLPEWLITEETKENKKDGRLHWTSTTMSISIGHKEPSVFNSMSAAPDSGRSFTANLVILDEWAFQQWARDIWSAAYPTINRPSGGKVIGLSTAKRMTLFEDIWRMAKAKNNSFTPTFLPWSTDPRRTQEWYEQTKKDLPTSYKAEYPSTPEEAFEAAEGVAFPEYSFDIHVCEPFEIPSHWAKWRSVDNGYTDPFAWYWFAVDEQGTVYIYREYTREVTDDRVTYSEQAKKVMALTKETNVCPTVCGHDAWNVHHLTVTKATPHGKSLIDYYADGGLTDCVRAVTDRAMRKLTFHEYLKPYYDENMGIMVSRLKIFNTCHKIIETLPQLVVDPHDSEKIMECSIDHWADSVGYGLIYNHVNRSSKPQEVKKKKLTDLWKKKG